MTNLLKKNDQTGRSMVEMLGVLAIIGVLSVGGIAGYSKAMNKFKITKTMDQVSMTVANIRTLYSGQRNYSGITTAGAINMGVVPAEMEGSTTGTIQNAFLGQVKLGTATFSGMTSGAFYISYDGLGREACVSLATADWGSGANSGFVGLNVSGSEAAPAIPAFSDNGSSNKYGNYNLPLSPATAATACSCSNKATCSVVWWFF